MLKKKYTPILLALMLFLSTGLTNICIAHPTAVTTLELSTPLQRQFELKHHEEEYEQSLPFFRKNNNKTTSQLPWSLTSSTPIFTQVEPTTYLSSLHTKLPLHLKNSQMMTPIPTSFSNSKPRKRQRKVTSDNPESVPSLIDFNAKSFAMLFAAQPESTSQPEPTASNVVPDTAPQPTSNSSIPGNQKTTFKFCNNTSSSKWSTTDHMKTCKKKFKN